MQGSKCNCTRRSAFQPLPDVPCPLQAQSYRHRQLHPDRPVAGTRASSVSSCAALTKINKQIHKKRKKHDSDFLKVIFFIYSYCTGHERKLNNRNVFFLVPSQSISLKASTESLFFKANDDFEIPRNIVTKMRCRCLHMKLTAHARPALPRHATTYAATRQHMK